MGWLGKIIGGTIGFFLGGPFGLIAGAVFGNLFDQSENLSFQNNTYKDNYNNFYQQENSLDRSQMIYFLGTFSLLAKIAEADGNVSNLERQKVQEFMTRDLNLTGKSYEVANKIFNEALNKKNVSFQSLAAQFYQNFYNQPSILQLMIDILIRVAMSDGSLNSIEESLINEAARIFRISDFILENIKKSHGISSSEKAYAVLGLTKDASVDQIKKAYRKLSIDFHPDTVQSRGMAEEFKEYAVKHFREIQEAYEEIKKERGIK